MHNIITSISSMDDDDNDNNNEQEEEGEEQDSTSSYSKKKHFGRLEKDLRGCVKWQVYYRPRTQSLKPFSVKLENNRVTIAHKTQYGETKTNTKIKLTTKYDSLPRFNELNSKLSRKLWGSTLTFSNKISDNYAFSSKISHSVLLWDKLKIKYGLQLNKKKELSYGGSLTLNYKRNFTSIPYLPFLAFVSKYNQSFHIGTNVKTDKRTKYDLEYNSHITTRDSHKVYLSHKVTYDPNTRNPSPFSQVLTVNAQDGDSVATFNSSLHLEKFTIKTKEVRFLIEYDKRYRFGVQKKNEIYEFLVERYKISQKWLKTVKFSVGNKGCLTTLEGKLSVWKSSLEYGVNLRLKPGGGNFYNDFSSNLNLKWNL